MSSSIFIGQGFLLAISATLARRVSDHMTPPLEHDADPCVDCKSSASAVCTCSEHFDRCSSDRVISENMEERFL